MFSLLPAALFSIILAAAVSAKPGLSVTLTGKAYIAPAIPALMALLNAGPKEANGVGALIVTAKIVNTGDVKLQLLKDPRTVLNPLHTDTFLISNAAKKAPAFRGIKIKYSPETVVAQKKASGFTVLAPGASVEVKHDLSKGYDFTKSGAGAYNIVPRTAFEFVDAAGKLTPILATAKGTSVTLKGKLALRRVPRTSPGTTPHLGRRATFRGCSATQQKQVTAAAAEAQKLVDSAVKYLTVPANQLPKSTPRYVAWFGKLDFGRHADVFVNFQNMAFEKFDSYTYDCSCPFDEAFAFVDARRFGTINICKLFFTAKPKGSNSQAGVLVHEASHMIAGTQDFVSGKNAAQGLAIRDPNTAIQNADNYEFFAENEPALK
ncbi:Peptidyl-Lys metalloendopeptidase [Mycena indigotica]|uniref:Peptidyl-Lys metalloendopeptidase n=1 Tax=Mycena indigotica TaxID=2126181 RepID=A0A8H6WBF4_9AGAR|nr:Peptidyl-Lys metalloendopeptidase [Mycena indigotica]KAF7311762.1 Peptidyl-Lys metalloendopeptidase [Mycena indigotica]